MVDVRVEGPSVERGEEILPSEAIVPRPGGWHLPEWHLRVDDARALFERVALADEVPELLTLPAHELVP